MSSVLALGALVLTVPQGLRVKRKGCGARAMREHYGQLNPFRHIGLRNIGIGVPNAGYVRDQMNPKTLGPAHAARHVACTIPYLDTAEGGFGRDVAR